MEAPERRAPRAAVAASRDMTPELVGAPDDEQEGGEDRPLVEPEGGGANTCCRDGR